MTPIEDLVRQALQDAPTPAVTGDPVSQIAQRVRRARLQIGALAGVVAAVIAVAVVVPLAVVGGGTHSAPVLIGPSPSPQPPAANASARAWPAHQAVAATTTVDGSVWLLEGGDLIDRGTVVQQDPTGAVVRRIVVPGPVRGIASGAGAVWTYGGGDGGAPDGVLDRISPNGDVATIRFSGSGPYDIAFVDGTPFVTLASAHEVAAIGPGPNGGLAAVTSVKLTGQVTDLVSTDNGQLWVREDIDHRVVRVLWRGGALREGPSFPWRGGLLGPGPHNGIWTGEQPNRLIGLSPELAVHGEFSLAEGYRLTTPGTPVAIVSDGSRGGYVATAHGIAYYGDFVTAAQTDPTRPTAYLRQRDIVGMTAAPRGGVIGVTGDGHALQWDPQISGNR